MNITNKAKLFLEMQYYNYAFDVPHRDPVEDEWNVCPHPRPGSCTWITPDGHDTLKLDMPYFIHVASNRTPSDHVFSDRNIIETKLQGISL